MSLLDLVLYPDDRLRQECESVTEITDEVRTLLDNMAETMYEAPGIGLAAPQVGKLIRAIVVDVGTDEEGEPSGDLHQLINPVITAKEGQTESEEGCLSIPDIREMVKRSEKIEVKAVDRDGKDVTLEADGLLSICIQHEIDHLNGVLFIDYLSRLKKELIKKKLKKLSMG